MLVTDNNFTKLFYFLFLLPHYAAENLQFCCLTARIQNLLSWQNWSIMYQMSLQGSEIEIAVSPNSCECHKKDFVSSFLRESISHQFKLLIKLGGGGKCFKYHQKAWKWKHKMHSDWGVFNWLSKLVCLKCLF